MPQIIAFALIGGLGWYAYKQLKRHMAKIDDELKKSDKNRDPAAAQILEKGEDGVYRPGGEE